MPETYTVQIVSEREWERLRQKDPRYANIEDSLGFADPEIRRGYVRQTYWPELNKFLMEHEFEHLLHPEYGADRDAHGIYHKKFFKQVVAPIALPILGALAGPAVGGALAGAGGLSGVGSAIAAGAGGALGGAAGQAVGGGNVGKGALLGGLGGVASRAIPAVVKAVTGPSAPSTQQLGARITGAAPIQPTQPSPLVSLPSAQQSFSQAQQTVAPRLTGGLTSGLSRFSFPPVSPTAPPAAPVVPPIPNAAGGNFLSTLTQKAGGLLKTLGTGVAGNLATNAILGGGQPAFDAAAAASLLGAAQAVSPPQVPSLTAGPLAQEALTMARRGFGTDVGRLAQARLSEQLTAPIDATLPPGVQARLQRQFGQEERNVRGAFKQFQPGASEAESSDLAQQLADLRQRQAESEGRLGLSRQQELEGLRRQDIAQALGVDEQGLNVAFQLASLEASQIALQAGVDFGTAMAFKQTMGQLAGLFATRGLGLNRFTLDIPQLANP